MGILGLHDEEQIGVEKVETSHAGGYHASDDIELVAVADVDEAKLERFGDVWEIDEQRRYLGHEAMLEAEDLDIVSVCTPTFLHHDHVLDAAESAADPEVIWAEKPLASSVADGEAMIEVCDGTDTELFINHSFRFDERFRELRRLIQEAELLGEIKSASAQFRMELMRNSTHLLDMLIFLLDAHPRRVAGYITGENEAVDALDGTRAVDDSGGGGMLVMDDDTFVTVDCTIPRDISTMYFQLIGTNGKLYINPEDGDWRFWKLEDGEHVEQSLSLGDGTGYDSSFVWGAEHAVELIEGTEQCISSGATALKSLEIIACFYISHYTDSLVETPLEPPLKKVEITSW